MNNKSVRHGIQDNDILAKALSLPHSLFRSVGSSKNAIQLANTPLDAQYFQGIRFNLFGSNS